MNPCVFVAKFSPVNLPKISIVTCSYQQARFLERTIRSVLDQGYPNLEFIVIDGASTDGSVEIIKKYADRLAYWISEPDNGQAGAINKGLKRATGQIVGWLNSDDTLAPGSLMRIGRYFASHPRVDLLYGHVFRIDADDRILRRLGAVQTSAHELINLNRNIFAQPGTTWRRRIHDRIGYLDESLHLTLDADWWIRVARQYRIKCIPYHLANLRVYPETKSLTMESQSAKLQAELDARYGAVPQSKWRVKLFHLRRYARIIRQPRNWLYLCGMVS